MSDTKLLSPKIINVDFIVFSSSSSVVSFSSSASSNSPSYSSVTSSSSLPDDIFLVNIPPNVNPPFSSPSVSLDVFDTSDLKYDELDVDIIVCCSTPKSESSSEFTFIFVAFNNTAFVSLLATLVDPRSSTMQLAYPYAMLSFSVSYT